MADHDRYNDRRYMGPERDRRPRPGDDADYGQADYGYPRGDRDDPRSYAPYGVNGPVRSGGESYDRDGHPLGYRGDPGRRPRYADDDRYREREAYPGREIPNVRGGRGEEARTWWDRATDTVQSWLGDDDAQRRHHWDEMRHAGGQWPERQGEHRGHGPKGYRRSDERIREDVNDRLTDDPYLDASSIEVTVANGEVTLSGAIMRREDKRRAEILAESLSGVTHVQNNLRLKSDSGEPPVLDPTLGPTF